MRRGGVLLLGAAVLLGALAFGSQTLGVAGIGLVLAGGATRGWAAVVRSSASAVLTVDPSPAVEGDEVVVRIDTRRVSSMPVGVATLRADLGRLGPFDCRLRGHRRLAHGELRLGRLPRGRFVVTDAVLELRDPLGLESVVLRLDTPAAVVAHPRLVELGSLWSDAGRLGADGRLLLLRRHAGFDFHSVREYEQGESLRRVHWPTTARRGQLMVKELEESPRDAVAVVLDCDPAGAAGVPPDSSFDAAVRAAGSVLAAHCARGRRAVLVTTGVDGGSVGIGSLAGDFGAALGVLAAAEPDAPDGLDGALAHARGPAAQAGELVIVTSTLGHKAVERLLDTARRRLVSVVWVDAPSWAGRRTRADRGVLRLADAGVPVAVVRRGDDLAAALEAARGDGRAHG
jgi:uncharacterized protein (DUF58 family)